MEVEKNSFGADDFKKGMEGGEEEGGGGGLK